MSHDPNATTDGLPPAGGATGEFLPPGATGEFPPLAPGTADFEPAPPPRAADLGTIDQPADGAVGGATNTFDYAPDDPQTDVVTGGGPRRTSGAIGTEDHSPTPSRAPTADPSAGGGSGAVRADGPRYDLKKVHARGGMGEVWLAEDVNIGRSVALAAGD